MNNDADTGGLVQICIILLRFNESFFSTTEADVFLKF